METILVVDDEPVVLKLCQTILRRGGYDVLTATGGEEALRLLQNGPPINLALLDVIMPGMNGIELANRIEKTSPSTKVVLMSGYGPREIARVVGENPYRIIWKPFKTESLLRMIENVLGEPTGAAV